ncbi:hypothetical protein GCM10010342_28180 [Streptomyces anulatus]|nr:hypothetical protein GCM10010342_28180 [Streptomyces anulatus]
MEGRKQVDPVLTAVLAAIKGSAKLNGTGRPSRVRPRRWGNKQPLPEPGKALREEPLVHRIDSSSGMPGTSTEGGVRVGDIETQAAGVLRDGRGRSRVRVHLGGRRRGSGPGHNNG